MKLRAVLLVEDNPDDEALVLRAFRKAKVPAEVVVARDGVEALEYLFGTGTYAGRDVADHPAVVLLDLQLPKINGLEVLRQLRADSRTEALPVVVWSSSGEDRDVADAKRLCASGYVRKPSRFDQLTDAVRQVASRWLEPSPAFHGNEVTAPSLIG